jgi:sec-independent protein translocase protein TatB
MFDIGFTEMMIIAVVALVVLGPERLPKVAKQAGEWMGKLRRYVDDVKSDINRQMELDELRKLKSQVQDAAQSLKSSVEGVVNDTKNELSELNSAFAGTLTTPPGSDAPTDWDRIYAVRRARERIKDRRIERSKELGMKRPKRAYPRFTRPVFEDEPITPASNASAIAAASPSIGSVMSVDSAIAAAVPSHDATPAPTASVALAHSPAVAVTQGATS